mgnify:CR=1 FL=1
MTAPTGPTPFDWDTHHEERMRRETEAQECTFDADDILGCYTLALRWKAALAAEREEVERLKAEQGYDRHAALEAALRASQAEVERLRKSLNTKTADFDEWLAQSFCLGGCQREPIPPFGHCKHILARKNLEDKAPRAAKENPNG